jgi:hypothetical protein
VLGALSFFTDTAHQGSIRFGALLLNLRAEAHANCDRCPACCSALTGVKVSWLTGKDLDSIRGAQGDRVAKIALAVGEVMAPQLRQFAAMGLKREFKRAGEKVAIRALVFFLRHC